MDDNHKKFSKWLINLKLSNLRYEVNIFFFFFECYYEVNISITKYTVFFLSYLISENSNVIIDPCIESAISWYPMISWALVQNQVSKKKLKKLNDMFFSNRKRGYNRILELFLSFNQII